MSFCLGGMPLLKHIVMWEFKDKALGKNKIENILKAKKMIEGLKGVIPDIVDLELGINKEGSTGSYDLVLYSVFKDISGLDSYQNHPEHLEIVGFMKEVINKRACVDYEN
jgi:hypothetical protein